MNPAASAVQKPARKDGEPLRQGLPSNQNTKAPASASNAIPSGRKKNLNRGVLLSIVWMGDRSSIEVLLRGPRELRCSRWPEPSFVLVRRQSCRNGSPSFWQASVLRWPRVSSQSLRFRDRSLRVSGCGLGLAHSAVSSRFSLWASPFQSLDPLVAQSRFRAMCRYSCCDDATGLACSLR